MKKNYFFILVALLLASWVKAEAQEPATQGVANNFLWYKLIQAEEEKTLLQVPQQIVASKDGNVFATQLYHSKKRDEIASIFNYDAASESDKAFSYGDDGKAANGNTNFSFYKIDPTGKLLWHIYSSRGDYYSNRNTLVATPDGGFVVVLTSRDANSSTGTERDLVRIIQSDGTPYDINIKSLYRGVGDDEAAPASRRAQVPLLLKVSKEGKVEFYKTFDTSHEPQPDASHYDYGTNGGIAINAVALDEQGNIYMGGKLFTTISLGGKTYKAKNIVGWNGDPQKTVGDLILIKLNSQGEFQECHMEEGDPITSSEIREMRWKDGKLYWAGGFIGTKDSKAVTVFGKSVVATLKRTMVFGCLNSELKGEWLSQLDAKVVKGPNPWSLIFIDGIAVGQDKVYIAGRCSGGLYYSDGTEYLVQPLKQHRGYVLALDKTTGKPIEKQWSLLPEVGISNAVDVSTAGKKVIVTGYNLGAKAFYRVLDQNLSEQYADHHYVDKAMVNFGGDVVRNMFIGNARARNSGADILTTTGYKHIEKNKYWMGIIVAHKLPFPFLSADQAKLDLAKMQNKLEVYSSELTTPIKVTLSGEGFKSDLNELPADGGFLNISFSSAETATPELREGKLTLTSGEESYEVLLSAMTVGKKEITRSVQTLDFAEVPAGETKSLDLTLGFKNITEAVTCKIEGSDAKYFALDKEQIDDVTTEAKLTVTFSPTKELKKFTDAFIVIKSGAYEVRVPLLGKAIYTLGVAATELNFAKVKEGETKTMNLEVAPKGLGDAMITVEVTEGQNNFSVDKSSISGKETSTLAITFKPTSDIKATTGKLVLKAADLEEIIVLRGSNATGTDVVAKAQLTVIAREGELVLKSETRGEIRIYDLSGKMLYSETLEGEKSFALAAGSYVVSFNGATHKVVIR